MSHITEERGPHMYYSHLQLSSTMGHEGFQRIRRTSIGISWGIANHVFYALGFGNTNRCRPIHYYRLRGGSSPEHALGV